MCKVLSDHSGNPKQDKKLTKSPETTDSEDEDSGTATDTPSETPKAEIR
jgi:hypothetical protein